MKLEFLLSTIASSVLHVVAFIIIARAVTAPQAQTVAMETFIVAPVSALEHVARLSTPHVARVISEQRDIVAEQPVLPEQKHNPSITIAKNSVQESYQKSEVPPSVPIPAATSMIKYGNATNDASVSSTPIKRFNEESGSHSASTSQHGIESINEMSLGDVGAPRFIHREAPLYPFLARKLGKEGKVIVRLTLDERGKQKNIEIVAKDGFGFTEAAVQALIKSIFSPAMKNGRPIVSRVVIPVRFVLNGD